jgi:hypothetical protein
MLGIKTYLIDGKCSTFNEEKGCTLFFGSKTKSSMIFRSFSLGLISTCCWDNNNNSKINEHFQKNIFIIILYILSLALSWYQLS